MIQAGLCLVERVLAPAPVLGKPRRACSPSCRRNTLRRVPSGALNPPARTRARPGARLRSRQTSRTVSPKWWMPLIMPMPAVSVSAPGQPVAGGFCTALAARDPRAAYRSIISSRCRMTPGTPQGRSRRLTAGSAGCPPWRVNSSLPCRHSRRHKSMFLRKHRFRRRMPSPRDMVA